MVDIFVQIGHEFDDLFTRVSRILGKISDDNGFPLELDARQGYVNGVLAGVKFEKRVQPGVVLLGGEVLHKFGEGHDFHGIAVLGSGKFAQL